MLHFLLTLHNQLFCFSCLAHMIGASNDPFDQETMSVRGSGVGCRLGLAVPAQPEQLEPVTVDPIAAATADLGRPPRRRRFRDLGSAAAARQTM